MRIRNECGSNTRVTVFVSQTNEIRLAIYCLHVNVIFLYSGCINLDLTVFGFISRQLESPSLLPVSAVNFINTKINSDIWQLCCAIMTSES
jgi:hypothetical protein